MLGGLSVLSLGGESDGGSGVSQTIVFAETKAGIVEFLDCVCRDVGHFVFYVEESIDAMTKRKGTYELCCSSHNEEKEVDSGGW